jgi:hypothetical protein
VLFGYLIQRVGKILTDKRMADEVKAPIITAGGRTAPSMWAKWRSR